VQADTRIARKAPATGRRRLEPGGWVSGVILLGALVLWQVAADNGLVNATIVSKPTEVWSAARASMSSPDLFVDFLRTFSSIFIGLALAVAVGTPLGLAMALYKPLRWSCEWILNLFNSLPRLALAPILIIALGLGLVSKVAMAYISAVIPITLLITTGTLEIPTEIHRVAACFRLSRIQILFKILLPAVSPHLLNGIQLGFSRALASVVVAELYNPQNGLGRWIAIGQVSLDTSQLIFASLLIAITGAVTVGLLNLLERRLVRWR